MTYVVDEFPSNYKLPYIYLLIGEPYQPNKCFKTYNLQQITNSVPINSSTLFTYNFWFYKNDSHLYQSLKMDVTFLTLKNYKISNPFEILGKFA